MNVRSQLTVGLVFGVLVSAIAVEYATFMSRQEFAELQRLRRDAEVMQSDLGRLSLELGVWGAYTRVEKVAREQLGMVAPSADDIEVIIQ